jgi:hypothetical protein
MILNIQSIIEYHNKSSLMQNEQVLDEDNNITPDKNEFSSVDSRVTVIRYPTGTSHEQQQQQQQELIEGFELMDEDSPFKLKLFPVNIFDERAYAT